MILVFSLLALLVGVVLGLLGGGGSILMVPLLVYVVGLSPGEAVPVSLLVVGITSLVALAPHARQGRVRLGVGLLFGGAGMVGAFGGGLVSQYIASVVLVSAFGVLMLATGVSMRRRRGGSRPLHRRQMRVALVLITGAGVGFAAGLLGAGGGFLVMPALVLFGGLSVRNAIGTSLFVIALQSLAGFVGHLGQPLPDLGLAAALCAAAATGSLLGGTFSGRVPQEKLRKAFAWLVMGLGCFVLFAPVRLLLASLFSGAWPWWAMSFAGGVLIGLAASLLWLLERRIAGVSGIVGGLTTAPASDRSWRMAFLLGLLGGGSLMAALMPSSFEVETTALGVVVVAGLLVGVGTTLANGCTSGHGVCGVSRLSRRSLAATATFTAAGALAVYLVRIASAGFA